MAQIRALTKHTKQIKTTYPSVLCFIGFYLLRLWPIPFGKASRPRDQMDTHQVGHGEEFDLFTAEITDLKQPWIPCGSVRGIFHRRNPGDSNKYLGEGWLKTTVLFMG